MRAHIDLDDKRIAEAMGYADVKSKQELVDLALREFVEQRRRRNLLDLYGKGSIFPGYDHKKLRAGED